MTPREEHRTGPAPRHSVHLYETASQALDTLAEFVHDGIRRGEAVVLIITPGRMKGLKRILPAIRPGEFVALDARRLLRRVMRQGRPDAALLLAAFEELRAEIGGRPFRVFGEAVDLLCRDGEFDAAAELEELWNGLRREHPFSLF